MKALIKEDLVVHPAIVIDQIGAFHEPDEGHTVLISAIRHAIQHKNTICVKYLLHLGFPMYHATKKGTSVLNTVFKDQEKTETADELLKMFIDDYSFDPWQSTKFKDQISGVRECNSAMLDFFLSLEPTTDKTKLRRIAET